MRLRWDVQHPNDLSVRGTKQRKLGAVDTLSAWQVSLKSFIAVHLVKQCPGTPTATPMTAVIQATLFALKWLRTAWSLPVVGSGLGGLSDGGLEGGGVVLICGA